jgi:hypothetical protein
MGSLVSLSYGFLLVRDMSLITYMIKIDVVTCRLNNCVYVRKSIEKRFALRTRDVRIAFILVLDTLTLNM